MISAVRHRDFRFRVSVEQLVLLVALFWTVVGNHPFFKAALRERSFADGSTWGFVLALVVILIALHFILLVFFANRWTVKPLLALLVVSTAPAIYFMQVYGVYLDPSMLRNVLRTDRAEASELLSWGLLVHLLLYAVVPLWFLWRVEIVRRSWGRAMLRRLAALLLGAVIAGIALLAIFQPFSSLMRNHKEVRYLITPANYLWSLISIATTAARGAATPRQAIGLDAAPGTTWAAANKPMLLVLVVGETARAANWGLNGYVRPTTPELTRLPVINFSDVSSCGTNTEVSLPCMFAPIGRRDYDARRIEGSESLLHVLARAGVGVHWRDNQSGCKGVCEGLSTDSVADLAPPGMCSGGRCLDGGLLFGLDERLARTTGRQLLVLHQLGNHGPSYFRRYPREFARFQPACANDDLQRCSREEIVNSYDNALVYTDHVLAGLIAKLQAQAGKIDTALLYVSDHGESLGENNLFLHGLPYAIAPKEQTQVPMVLWFSAGFAQRLAIDVDCLQQRASQPASHDHLFHTVLGLLDVHTGLYEPDWDLLQHCRRAPPQAP
ncbi:MAG TPA: phosphoethanolamine--lipid A transferase [Accumulibacter sp.]|nr:phosphoethanolamine--lipid A transferase [Accumulibacter sp.]HNC18256.1 phosphoethanolamine--lipid A transferase [Accumulibacter sp.]HND80530.1 phosphoethanolamine--lipid A transferase [Accumulibacter sp.]HNE13528.1 phosphoethanolamine--lipid A transferase [Accumulibacter sp.]HNI73206.1 phosphoethanolamine--lipid A transferase [Accumulibacter sp.]